MKRRRVVLKHVRASGGTTREGQYQILGCDDDLPRQTSEQGELLLPTEVPINFPDGTQRPVFLSRMTDTMILYSETP